jgi:hypothetical protein
MYIHVSAHEEIIKKSSVANFTVAERGKIFLFVVFIKL